MKKLIFLICLSLSLSYLCAQQKGASPLDGTGYPTGTLAVGNTYAVVVGISDYQDESIPDLRFADKDAEAFAAFLQSPAGGSLDEDHLKVMINEQATQAQFAKALDWMWEVVGENDRAIIYFSGHGDVEKKSFTQPGFLLCWDAPARVYMAGGAFPLPMLQEVVTTLSLSNKAKVIVIADACRSGKLSGSTVGGTQLTSGNLAKQYANEIKILSCQPNEYSIEGEQWGGGRGAFSYHLLDGLYGMADANGDNHVNLKEISRYLEDRVSEEVAPQNQNPMTIGSVTEGITNVFPDLLEQLKEGKKGQLQLFTSTESRGIEEQVLAVADSNIVQLYMAFKQSLEDKQFFKPATSCTDYYYKQLSQEPQLEKLHSTMRRNYAAALQDDAQQVINKVLRDDNTVIGQLMVNKTSGYEQYPNYLQTAAELLGEEHYMYPILQSRKLAFEGYLLQKTGTVGDRKLGNKVLVKYREALKWQPERPEVYFNMAGIYFFQMQQPDSAEYYTKKAVALAPSWVLPYTALAGNYLSSADFKDVKKTKYFLEQSDKIDPTAIENNFIHMLVWALYYQHNKKIGKTEQLYKNILSQDTTWTIALHNLGLLYYASKRYDLAENTFKKLIQIDPENAYEHLLLGRVYEHSKNYPAAEKAYEKAFQLDSTNAKYSSELAMVYFKNNRYSDAEQAFKKSVQLNPDRYADLYNLACLYSIQNRSEEAFDYLERSLKAGYTNYNWMQKDDDVTRIRKQKDKWEALMKKYFPDQFKN